MHTKCNIITSYKNLINNRQPKYQAFTLFLKSISNIIKNNKFEYNINILKKLNFILLGSSKYVMN